MYDCITIVLSLDGNILLQNDLFRMFVHTVSLHFDFSDAEKKSKDMEGTFKQTLGPLTFKVYILP